jgi:DNA-binding response OmpR family regulator
MTNPDFLERGRGQIIMGVDDAAENLSFLKTILTLAGYNFYGVSGGEECLQCISRVSPRLILLDVEMQHMDGFQTCRRLRTVPELHDVPIIFLTVRKTEYDVQQGLQAGGDDFMIKPFDVNQLLQRVRRWTAPGLGRGRAAER